MKNLEPDNYLPQRSTDVEAMGEVHPLLVPAGAQGQESSSLADKLSGQSLQQMIESYVRYYAAGEGHTARAKRYDLRHFLEFLVPACGALSEIQVFHWTSQATKDFVDYRLSLGEAPATVARRLATIKHFGRTLAERVPGYINPAREVKTPVIHQGRPQGLSAEEIELLREAAAEEQKRKKHSFLSVRNAFLLELLLSTGLRADEVRLLLVSQISEDRSWLKNVKTKGRKFRNVYLDTQIRQKLNLYLDAREDELRKKFPGYEKLSSAERVKIPVFISLYDANLLRPASFGLAPKTIWRVIAAFGARARAASTASMPNLHPHVLRHTFAHGLLDTSKDVRLVAQALGHSDVRITMRYTERTEEELARAIEEKTSQGR
ncbi:MAG TPA: tyrosine-type recombinase/integrase [Oligoflexia bacterium]|nr:tyrosine-type recombinase/integrase [Oligoflexia bacterium]